MFVLSLNCGSSSVKYLLYDWDKKRAISKGIVERVTIGRNLLRLTINVRTTKQLLN